MAKLRFLKLYFLLALKSVFLCQINASLKNLFMRKRWLLIAMLLIGLGSCDDGNLDVSSFEFEDEVNLCGDQVFTLYRLSTNGRREALMVTLTDQELRKDQTPVLPVNVTETGTYTVTYRLFDEEVTSSYFCATVPPTEPKVVKDWRGVSGTIFVQNNPKYDDDGVTIINWEHIIVLNDVVLRIDDQELKLDDTYLFGTVLTGPAD